MFWVFSRGKLNKLFAVNEAEGSIQASHEPVQHFPRQSPEPGSSGTRYDCRNSVRDTGSGQPASKYWHMVARNSLSGLCASVDQVDHAGHVSSSPVAVCNAGGRVDAFNLPFLHLTRRIMLSSSSLINPSYTESKQMSNGGTCIRESKSYASFNCSEENLSYERPFRQGTVGRWTARPASHPGDPRPGKHTPEILQPQLSPLADPLLHILYGL